jgi:predicted kinase
LHGQESAGYEVMKALAREQLAVGLSAVIDAVNPFDWVRSAYQQIAADCDTPALFIVTSCADRALHRRRVEERHAAGLKSITWEEVERKIDYYEPFTGDALTLDAGNPVDQNLAAAVSYVQRP